MTTVVAVLEIQNEELRAQLAELTAQHASAVVAHKAEVDFLTQQVRDSRKELQRLESRLVEAEEDQLAAEDTITIQQRDQQELIDLRRQLVSESHDADKAREMVIRLQEQMAELRNQVDVERSARLSLEKWRVGMEQRVSATDTLLRESNSDNQALKRDLSVAESNLSKIRQRAQDLEAQLERQASQQPAQSTTKRASVPSLPLAGLRATSEQSATADGPIESSFAFNVIPVDTPGRGSVVSQTAGEPENYRARRLRSVSVSDATPALNINAVTPRIDQYAPTTDRTPLLSPPAASPPRAHRSKPTPNKTYCPCVVS
jgi:hypothetical protein